MKINNHTQYAIKLNTDIRGYISRKKKTEKNTAQLPSVSASIKSKKVRDVNVSCKLRNPSTKSTVLLREPRKKDEKNIDLANKKTQYNDLLRD